MLAHFAARARTPARAYSRHAARSVYTVPELLDVRVRKRRLAALDVVEQRLVHGRVEGRRLVLPQLLLPERVGALDHVLRAFRLPLLDAVAVGERRAVERRLEGSLRG